MMRAISMYQLFVKEAERQLKRGRRVNWRAITLGFIKSEHLDNDDWQLLLLHVCQFVEARAVSRRKRASPPARKGQR